MRHIGKKLPKLDQYGLTQLVEMGTIRIVVRIFKHYIWVSTGGEGCEQLYDQQNFEEDNLLGVKKPFVSMTTIRSNTCIHFVVLYCSLGRNMENNQKH